MTPVDVASIKSVSQVKISSDGKYIAYTVSNPADPFKENVAARTPLYVFDVSSNTSTPFYTQSSAGALSFRPGSNSITFLSQGPNDKVKSLYEISLSGGEAVKLFEHATAISKYEWSVDGKLLITAKEKVDEKTSVLPYQPEIYEEDLPFTRAYIIDLEKGKATQVNIDGHIDEIRWSPDGSRIAVSAAPTPLIDDFYMRQSIYIVNSTTSEVIGQVNHSGKLGEFEWSSNGSKLAFRAGANLNDPIDGRILIVDADGGNPKNLAPEFSGKFEKFSWKDGNTLYYLSSEGVYSAFGTLNISNGALTPSITSGSFPILKDYSIADDGSLAFIGESPNYPKELFFMGKKDRSPKRITDSNPWLADKVLGKQEVVKYKARDGMEIEGLLIRPVGERQGQKYPLITVIHGGPEAHYDNGWLTSYSSAGHLGAGNGYAVFYPNYRGSTGRGLEFTMSSQADLAGKEFDDVVDGVDYLIESGLVDGSKVGATGGSYGGYATAWMATKYSDRFAAGVMFVGISNNLSKWGTSDIPEELYQVHARKRVWEDYDFFMDRSPVKYVDNAKTPLLIMHGKNDTRVYPGQSMELYRHIKTRTDTPVRLVFYPGEGHGNRKATARFDYNLRMMRWFDNYLKGSDNQLDTTIDLPEKSEK